MFHCLTKVNKKVTSQRGSNLVQSEREKKHCQVSSKDMVKKRLADVRGQGPKLVDWLETGQKQRKVKHRWMQPDPAE